jgi:3-isopropylmalate dehydrogenase
VLRALASVSPITFDLRFGGLIGTEAESRCGQPLSGEVVEFCAEIFSAGGAILAGPGGGRFVYDLRKKFDLFCKLSPLRVSEGLVNAARMKPECIGDVDILLIRENVEGLYQGEWRETVTENEGRRAEQTFFYTEKRVRRIMEVAARIARLRRGEMTIVIKDGGVPSISRLWRDCAAEAAMNNGVGYSVLNIDLMAYRLLQEPKGFDVVVTPNLFGDILADLGAVLLGSRGLSYSGNFSGSGAAVYQTNHGAGYDLVGKNEANPVGQVFSLAMLLRESFGLVQEPLLMEEAVAEVWRQGWRTPDLTENGCRIIGTEEMGARIADALVRLASYSRVK